MKQEDRKNLHALYHRYEIKDLYTNVSDRVGSLINNTVSFGLIEL